MKVEIGAKRRIIWIDWNLDVVVVVDDDDDDVTLLYRIFHSNSCCTTNFPDGTIKTNSPKLLT